jgi:hypothetical protein
LDYQNGIGIKSRNKPSESRTSFSLICKLLKPANDADIL